jgi:hypothetical protein
MSLAETHLQRAERRVREAQNHVRRQKHMIARLDAFEDKSRADAARNLLREFERDLLFARQVLERARSHLGVKV